MSDGHDKWIDYEAGKGWYVREVGGGWAINQGPYRYKWVAAIVWLFA